MRSKNKGQEWHYRKFSEFLEPGERLIAAVVGYQLRVSSNELISFGDFPFDITTIYYIGLTTRSLILRKEWVVGIIKEIERISLDQRRWAELSSDNRFDKFSLMWGNNNEELDLLIAPQQHSEAKVIVDVFTANQPPLKNERASLFHSEQFSLLNPRGAYHNQNGLSVRALLIIIFVMGILVMIGVERLFAILYPVNRPEVAGDILLFITFFIWGWWGIVVVKRKEVPGFFTVRGKLAVAQGIVITSMMWFVALWALLDVIRRLLAP
jgi:hypothetical protein